MANCKRHNQMTRWPKIQRTLTSCHVWDEWVHRCGMWKSSAMVSLPICSMALEYEYLQVPQKMLSFVGKHSIHGASGLYDVIFRRCLGSSVMFGLGCEYLFNIWFAQCRATSNNIWYGKSRKVEHHDKSSGIIFWLTCHIPQNYHFIMAWLYETIPQSW